jgi:RNA polymerase sigma-70 factor (ECF subfamily)
LPTEDLIRLVEAVRDGHPERMAELLARSAGIVHALARARLGDGFAAEEAAADALCRVARGLPGLAEPRSYVSWLGRIASRCAADVARKPAATVGPERTEPADPGPGPAAATEAAERAGAIRRAVAGLPPKLRQPVLLHYVEGLSYREIAHALGTGLSSVARRMEKALRTLKQALGEEP